MTEEPGQCSFCDRQGEEGIQFFGTGSTLICQDCLQAFYRTFSENRCEPRKVSGLFSRCTSCRSIIRNDLCPSCSTALSPLEEVREMLEYAISRLAKDILARHFPRGDFLVHVETGLETGTLHIHLRVEVAGTFMEEDQELAAGAEEGCRGARYHL